MADNLIPFYLESLNPAQREAVLTKSPVLLVLAGAGSGKTRVITTKIAYALDCLGYNPYQILALTFTNKAALEMKERVAKLTPQGSEVMVKTFHSFGAWLLRHYSSHLGINSNFVIYDENDALRLLKSELGSEYQSNLIDKYFSLIMRAKDLSLNPEDDLTVLSLEPKFQEIYKRYQTRLKQTGNFDFGDLILQNVNLLKKYPQIRLSIQQRFKMILVDEFQDTNYCQFELLKIIYTDEIQLTVVGDDDQAIYGFRGAEVKNILTFNQFFPQVKIINLNINYRSTKKILAAASMVIENNKNRMAKVITASQEEGQNLKLYLVQNYEDEANLISQLIKEEPFTETAVMYRLNYQSRIFEEIFSRKKIPYRLIGSIRFYEREEIKDVLAYLAFIVNPSDLVALERIINKPARGIGEQTKEKIFGLLKNNNYYFSRKLLNLIENIDKKTKKALESFLALIEHLLVSLENSRLDIFLLELIESTGLKNKYADKEDGFERLKNLEELVNAATAYGEGQEAINQFLENIILTSPEYQDMNSGEFVTLITLHNTKGLEFERVIITGCEEGVFPIPQKLTDEKTLEEERRLFYVGLTRAKKKLILTSSQSRLLFGRTLSCEPSRFLAEISNELINLNNLCKPETKNQSRFQRGMHVYSYDYGPGYVISSRWIEDSEVVTVRFEFGREIPIILKYHDLIKIKND